MGVGLLSVCGAFFEEDSHEFRHFGARNFEHDGFATSEEIVEM